MLKSNYQFKETMPTHPNPHATLTLLNRQNLFLANQAADDRHEHGDARAGEHLAEAGRRLTAGLRLQLGWTGLGFRV